MTYAETHPERVSELILRGIFMIRKKELDFFYQKGANFIFPDAWESYRDAIPVLEIFFGGGLNLILFFFLSHMLFLFVFVI